MNKSHGRLESLERSQSKRVPLENDNDWVLQQAADHPIVVGLVGDLIPGSPSYGRELDRLHANPLFVGIRYGNLWDRDLSADK